MKLTPAEEAFMKPIDDGTVLEAIAEKLSFPDTALAGTVLMRTKSGDLLSHTFISEATIGHVIAGADLLLLKAEKGLRASTDPRSAKILNKVIQARKVLAVSALHNYHDFSPDKPRAS